MRRCSARCRIVNRISVCPKLWRIQRKLYEHPRRQNSLYTAPTIRFSEQIIQNLFFNSEGVKLFCGIHTKLDCRKLTNPTTLKANASVHTAYAFILAKNEANRVYTWLILSQNASFQIAHFQPIPHKTSIEQNTSVV